MLQVETTRYTFGHMSFSKLIPMHINGLVSARVSPTVRVRGFTMLHPDRQVYELARRISVANKAGRLLPGADRHLTTFPLSG